MLGMQETVMKLYCLQTMLAQIYHGNQVNTIRVGTKMAFISSVQQKRFLRDTSSPEPFADQEFAFKIMLSVTRKMDVMWQRFDTKINFCVVVCKQENKAVCIQFLFCFWDCYVNQASARSPLPILRCAVVSFSVQRQLCETLLKF